MLHEQLEHLPQVGDRCVWQNYEFEVTEAEQHGQLRVMVRRALLDEQQGQNVESSRSNR